MHALGLEQEAPINRYLAILLAILTGIVHLAVTPLIVLNDVRPSLVVVAIVLVTALFGFELGIIWAFAAGVTVTLLGFEPLGTSPLTLLALSALVALAGRALGRLPWVFPIGAALLGSVLVDGLTLGIFALTGTELAVPNPGALILPAALFNAVLVAILLVPARLLALRSAQEEFSPW